MNYTSLFLILGGLFIGCGSKDSPTSIEPPPNNDTIDQDAAPTMSRAERLRAEAEEQANSFGYGTPQLQSTIPATLTFSDEITLTVDYGDSVFYKLDKLSHFSGYMIRPRMGNQFLVENRFFKSGSETVSITYISRDPSVVTVSTSGELKFVGPGETSVIVGAGPTFVDLPIRVAWITDIESRQKKTQVIETWGLPEGTRWAMLDWLDQVTINMKDYYNGEAGENLYIEQWYYNRIPRGYLEFRGDRADELRLYQIRTTRWEHISFSPIYPEFYTAK